MNKKEIAEVLRTEVGKLELSIKKTQARCDRLKQIVLDLEEEIAIQEGTGVKIHMPGKVRNAIDRVFGEKPKPRKP